MLVGFNIARTHVYYECKNCGLASAGLFKEANARRLLKDENRNVDFGAIFTAAFKKDM